VFVCPFVTLKHRFIEFTKGFQKAGYEFSAPFAYLNHDLGDFVQVAFLDARHAESDFA
jgi:hypothetical protein